LTTANCGGERTSSKQSACGISKGLVHFIALKLIRILGDWSWYSSCYQS